VFGRKEGKGGRKKEKKVAWYKRNACGQDKGSMQPKKGGTEERKKGRAI
jgi:hypothetical protein